MNSLAILAALTIVAALYAARRFQIQAEVERQRADHMTQMWLIVTEQRDAARTERDEAVVFAEELMVERGYANAIARHPAKGEDFIAPALSIVRGQS